MGTVTHAAYIQFRAGYIAALFATDVDGGGKLNEDAQLSANALELIDRDCMSFIERAGQYIPPKRLEEAGQDFWLTRNGHGAGFWDGDWPEGGSALEAVAEAMGSAEVYEGDDGQLYIM